MKKLLVFSLISALLMIGAPPIALVFDGLDAIGMIFILFFAINPIYSLIIGIFTGKSLKKLWPLPIISASLFLIGVFVALKSFDPAFLLYGAIYLLIGVFSALATAYLKYLKSKSRIL